MALLNEQQVTHYTDYNVNIPDLCSELSYFVIFNHGHNQQNQGNINKPPIVVTYRNQDITFKQILERFNKKNKNGNKRHGLKFTLSKGYRIRMKSTVLDLKKNLRKSNIDGIVLFTMQTKVQDQSDSEEQISLQNALMEFIGIQNQFDKCKKFTFHFLLPKCKSVISININPNSKVAQLIDQFFAQVVKQFKIHLQKQDIQEFRIKDTEIRLKSSITIQKVQKLYDDCQIQVIMLNKSIQFVKKNQEQNVITIVKEYISNITHKKQVKKIMIQYGDIKNMQISMINEKYFLQKGEIENKNNPICLKVMEIIIKGWQKLYKLDYAISKLKELGQVKLVGYLINQKMVFYKQVPQILKAKDAKQFSLEQLQIPNESKVERSKCEQLINERLSTIQSAYFQNKQHIEPILVYTSNLKYKDKYTGKISKIYDALNLCLRNQSVLKKSTIQICSEWVYRYTSTLLKHLQNVVGQKCKVFRGVNYDPQGKEGDLITFKPFTSTSKQIQVAVQFALQRYTQDDTLPLVIFQMQILSGKPIDKLSYYSTEQQILLQPFTQFIITNIKPGVSLRFPDFEGADFYNFTVYSLKEIPSTKQMPKATNNYILWVDNKPTQGKQTFNRYIEQFHCPTVLFQIQSNNQLRQWIRQRQDIINDSSSKIIMVTNMVRTQMKDQVLSTNYYAGVQSIHIMREQLPNIPIAVYVRDVKASNNNLDEKHVSRNNLEVISQFEDFIKFVEKHIQVKFRNIFPKQPVEPIKHVSSFEHQAQAANTQQKSKSSVSATNEKGKCSIM